MTEHPPEPPSSLARLATRGALWTGAGQYLWFALGIVKAIILARLVGREFFGLVAGATVWASFLGFTRLDLRLAVLTSREEPDVLDTQFLIENGSAFCGLALAGLLALGWPRLTTPPVWLLIFLLLAVSQLEALTSTHVYLTEKRLRQDVLGRLTTASAVVGFALPVILAVRGAAFPALIVDALVPLVIPRLGALVFIRWRPAFRWNLPRVREQLHLAWTMWSAGMLSKITFQLDDWLVFNLKRTGPNLWRSSGVQSEALYDRAYSVGKLPMDLAAGMIASNALALYVEGVARGREVLVGIHRRLTWLLAWIILSSGAYLFVAADDLVHILGDAWIPMVPLLRLMILFVVGRPLFQNNAQLLLALRHERDFRRSMAIQAIFIVAACPPAVFFFGAAGAAVSVSVMSVIGLASSERCVRRRLHVSGSRLYAVPAGTSILAVALVTMLAPFLPEAIWARAVVKAVTCGLVFGAGLALLDRPGAVDAWRTVRRGLRST